jgi:hypothetical protein
VSPLPLLLLLAVEISAVLLLLVSVLLLLLLLLLPVLLSAMRKEPRVPPDHPRGLISNTGRRHQGAVCM